MAVEQIAEIERAGVMVDSKLGDGEDAQKPCQGIKAALGYLFGDLRVETGELACPFCGQWIHRAAIAGMPINGCNLGLLTDRKIGRSRAIPAPSGCALN